MSPSPSPSPSPGTLLTVDYRPSSPLSPPVSSSSLRVVQWNIERGYVLSAVVDQLKRCEADIVVLQEVDVGNERSSFRDVFDDIARALQMKGVYLCEFIEIASQRRGERGQGGGHHGNATLTRFDVIESEVVHHSQTPPPIDWTRDGHRFNEPRRGERAILRTLIEWPQHKPVVVWNAHFEVFAGVLDRVQAWGDVFQDCRMMRKKYDQHIVACDANTMAHSIARFSAKYCRDKLRFLSLGKTEPEWLAQYVLRFFDADGAENTALRSFFPYPSEVPSRARNPGLIEPFDVSTDITLVNYWGLYQGKLDWCMISRDTLHVQSTWMGNNDYKASDHKWLMIAVTDQPSETSQLFSRNHARIRSYHCYCIWSGPVLACVTVFVALFYMATVNCKQ